MLVNRNPTDGVRNLNRAIELILSTINLVKISKDNDILKEKKIIYTNPMKIDTKLINLLVKSSNSLNASIEHLYL